MKKFILTIASVVLGVTALAGGTALAAPTADNIDNGDKGNTTEVTYGVKSGYEITIPKTVALSETGNSTEFVVTAKNYNITSGSTLNVSITDGLGADNNITLENAAKDEITTAASVTGATLPNVLSVSGVGDATGKSNTIKLGAPKAVSGSAINAGEYTKTVTFGAEVVAGN